MNPTKYSTALIIGAGSGISAAAARAFRSAGMTVALAARNAAKLGPLAKEVGGRAFAADASDPAEVEALFANVDAAIGVPDVVLFNAGARAPGPLADLDPEAVRRALEVGAFGGFLAVQQAARRMVPLGRGAILLTGASASVKGFPLSAAFGMAKFALRGLAQSAARELGPKGIHVSHFIVDGGVRPHGDTDDTRLAPESIASTFLHVLSQSPDAWSHEIDLRPAVERF